MDDYSAFTGRKFRITGRNWSPYSLHKDLTIKAKRDPKIAMENKDLPERLRESGISVSASEESVLQNLLPYINYYRLDYCL